MTVACHLRGVVTSPFDHFLKKRLSIQFRYPYSHPLAVLNSNLEGFYTTMRSAFGLLEPYSISFFFFFNFLSSLSVYLSIYLSICLSIYCFFISPCLFMSTAVYSDAGAGLGSDEVSIIGIHPRITESNMTATIPTQIKIMIHFCGQKAESISVSIVARPGNDQHCWRKRN